MDNERSMGSRIESGMDLLARLSEKPSLRCLDSTLFVQDPRSKDMVEIGGNSSSGKTLLLSQMLAKCILPQMCRRSIETSGPIEGCNASALLINTDHHFQISKLVDLMSKIVSDTLASSHRVPDAETVNVVVRNSLRNLTVIDCYDRDQFMLTLHTLDSILLGNANIGLLAIDGIAAYYWQDREDCAAWTIDLHVRKLLKVIRSHASRFDVLTIYTRARDLPLDSPACATLTRSVLDDVVDHRIDLHTFGDDVQRYICTIQSRGIVRKLNYTIQTKGIVWILDGGEG